MRPEPASLGQHSRRLAERAAARPYTAAMDPELLAGLRALADPVRMRILVSLAARPADAATVAAELRLAAPAVRRSLEQLADVGLLAPVADAPGRFTTRWDRVGALARSLAALEATATGGSGPGDVGAWPHAGETLAETLTRIAATPEEARTLRAYLVDGRLETIPAQDRKRAIVLRFLRERVFTEDRGYPEKEVNQRLALFHPDVAALRRYLVDARLVTREAGVYRRAADSPSDRA